MQEPAAATRQINADEFVALLSRHERRLRAFVAALLGRFEDIDEVVQNAWVVAWRKLDGFSFHSTSPDEEFLRWLCAIARFEVLAYRRQRGSALVFIDEKLLDDLADFRLEQTHYFESRHRALANCLRRLSPRDREMICARYGGGVSAQKLSDTTGRTLEAIYKSLGRIRMALATCIDWTLKQESRS